MLDPCVIPEPEKASNSTDVRLLTSASVVNRALFLNAAEMIDVKLVAPLKSTLARDPMLPNASVAIVVRSAAVVKLTVVTNGHLVNAYEPME